MIDPITAVSFSVFENKGTYALLLGSGISRAAQIPTGWEITLDLVRRLALLEGEEEQVDWAEWYKTKFGKEPSYSDVLNSLADTPDQRRAILHSYIEPSETDTKEGRKTPTKAHKAIARLVRDGFVRVILTTNFDRLLENSLREVGVEPTVIRSDDDIRGAIPLTHARCYILKLHGDYLDTRIRNTDAELGAYSNDTNLILDRVLDEFGLIVCGWSAEWDEALRAAISRAPNRRYTTFWTVRGKPAPLANDLIQNRAARLIEISEADEFFEILQRNVATQANLQPQNPRSIQLLIANAKRFIGRLEERIQLEEVISREIGFLATVSNTEEFDPKGQWSDERFQRTVSRYETISEPAGRLFGVLGRWGDGSEFRTVVDVIRNLASVPSRTGNVALNNLRSYPARLLFFGYGLGLLKAERYAELLRLFTATTETRPGYQTMFVDSIYGRWRGDDKDIWNKLPEFGSNRRYEPLSDHFHGIFPKWVSDYIIFPAEFTRLFESFELLGGLAFLTVGTDETSLREALSGSKGRNCVWAPIGRTSWDGESRQAIFESWKQETTTRALLDAGFAKGSPDFLSFAIKNFENLADTRW